MSASGSFVDWDTKASYSKEGRLEGASVVRDEEGREGETHRFPRFGTV